MLVVSTSDEKYRFHVTFKVHTKQVELYTCRVVPCIGLYVVSGQVIVFTIASNGIRVTLKIIDMLQICVILFNSVHTLQVTRMWDCSCPDYKNTVMTHVFIQFSALVVTDTYGVHTVEHLSWTNLRW